MRTQRIPVTTATEPEAGERGSITSGPIAKNAIYSMYPDGTPYVTQRSSVDMTLPIALADDPVPQKGRGIYFWDRAVSSAEQSTYYVVDNTVFRGGPTNAIVDKISSGTDPVTFLQLGDVLMILDYENNEAWYILAGAPEAIVAIHGAGGGLAQHPVNISTIVGGGAQLGGYLFLMDETGTIYNSNLDDPLVWSSVDFIKAEREADTAVYLAKQNDNLIAFGTSSVEFFRNAGNPNGSPLAVRPDIYYRFGAFDSNSVTDLGDIIYYVGSERVGKLSVFAIESFKVAKVSSDLIDSALNAVVRSKGGILISGMTIGAHRFVYVTIATQEEAGTPYIPTATFAFDSAVGVWSSYSTTVAEVVDHYPVVGVTNRGGAGQEEPNVMFISGDVGLITVHGYAEDTSGASDYYLSDVDQGIEGPGDDMYMQDDDAYVLPIAFASTTPIDFQLDLQPYDEGSMSYKFCHKMSLVGTVDSGSADNTNIDISYSDDHYRSFSTPRQLPTLMNRSLARWGYFKRRVWRIAYRGTERIKIEALEMKTGKSRNA